MAARALRDGHHSRRSYAYASSLEARASELEVPDDPGLQPDTGSEESVSGFLDRVGGKDGPDEGGRARGCLHGDCGRTLVPRPDHERVQAVRAEEEAKEILTEWAEGGWFSAADYLRDIGFLLVAQALYDELERRRKERGLADEI
jgi:hypothetical protein